MKTGLHFLWVALLAVGLAAALDNPGVVSLFWYETRVDASLNAVLVGLLFCLWLLVSAVRLWDKVRRSADTAAAWRQRQRERHVWSAVLDAITHLVAGQHTRAQDAAREALTALHRASHEDGQQWPRMGTLEVMANWVLAETARISANADQADAAFQAGLAVAGGEGARVAQDGLRLRAVKWALHDQDWSLAESRLAGLPKALAKRPQVWRFKLRLAQVQGRSLDALQAMKALAQLEAFSPRAANSLYSALAASTLRDAPTLGELNAAWSALDRARHTTPEVLCAFVQRRWLVANEVEKGPALAAELFKRLRLMDASFDALGERQRREWLDALEPLMPHLSKEPLAWVQGLIDTHVDDVWVQYMAISAWGHQGLWGKTKMAIDALLKRGSLPATLEARIWLLKATVAEALEDREGAHEAWKRSAQLQAQVRLQLSALRTPAAEPVDQPRLL